MNKPAERTQIDGLGDEVSFLTGLDCRSDIDRTRQEYKRESDINYILSRFGISGGGLPQKSPIWGETDYTLDLQQAFASIHAARDAWTNLPDDLRQRYPNWQTLLRALFTGDLKIDLEEHKEETTPTTPTT